jgi:hypothetical protein
MFLFPVFVGHGQASSTFKPNCTLPPPGTSYVAEPNTRSTLGILWNCLSIIILCTWNIQHLNVPAIRPPANGVLQQMWWAILDSRVKVKWMIVTILVPEFLVGKALGEWLSARTSVNDAKYFQPSKMAHWEMVHAYLANMGYFVLDLGDRVETQNNPATKAEIGSPKGDQDVPATPVPEENPPEDMPSLMIDPHNLHAQINMQQLAQLRYWTLNAEQWYKSSFGGLPIRPTSRRPSCKSWTEEGPW